MFLISICLFAGLEFEHLVNLKQKQIEFIAKMNSFLVTNCDI